MQKILENFLNKMRKEKVPCFIFLLKDKKDKPLFLEVIIKRPERYTEPQHLKKIPKKYYGLPVKVV